MIIVKDRDSYLLIPKPFKGKILKKFIKYLNEVSKSDFKKVNKISIFDTKLHPTEMFGFDVFENEKDILKIDKDLYSCFVKYWNYMGDDVKISYEELYKQAIIKEILF